MYFDYFDALTQILCAPCNTDESGGSSHFLLPAAPQEPMAVLPILCLLPLVPPSHARPIWSGRSICPIYPVAIQFLSFYQPARKIQSLQANRSKPIQSSRFTSSVNYPIPIHHPATSSSFVLPVLSFEGKPNKPPIMQPVPQNPISPRENHIFRTIHPNPSQYPQSMP